jgi:L-iditol 2-dehydrogenase
MGYRAAAALGFGPDSTLPDISAIPGISIIPGSIPGHEFIAEIAAVGEGVNGWKVGDRVVPGPGLPGVPQPITPTPPSMPGYETYRAFAEYMLTSPLWVQKVPDHVSDEEAVFVEPLATGVGSVLGAELRTGQSAAIIGAGKIGLLAMMSARVSGASPVIVVDMVQPRLDKALELGADAVVNASKVDVVSEIVRLTEDGADATIICVRDGKVLNQAVEMSSRGATIVLAGFVPPVEVNPMLWTFRQLRIVGVLGGPAHSSVNVITLSMYMIAHKQIDPKPLITEIIPFKDCQRAIDSAYSGKNIAVLMKP